MHAQYIAVDSISLIPQVDDEPVTPEVAYPGFRVFYNGLYVRLETNFSLIVEYDGVWTGKKNR